MIGVDSLDVTTISNRNVNWSTSVERVVEYPVHPLVRMYLINQNNLEPNKPDLNKLKPIIKGSTLDR